MHLYQKQKIFSRFFLLNFLNLDHILNIFKKKKTLVTVQIWMKAPLPYLLIPVKTIQFEKVSVSDM